MLSAVVVVIVGIIVAILFFAATRPDEFRIHRQGHIKASPEKIFPYLNDFHEWTKWSPWETLDEDLARKYSGAAKGEGAVYAWEGKKAGVGRMEIMETTPPADLEIKLNFEKPMKAQNKVQFVLHPEGPETRVDWTMTGPSPYMHKLMTIFMSMDKLVGGQFEQGLAKLKAVAEKA